LDRNEGKVPYTALDYKNGLWNDAGGAFGHFCRHFLPWVVGLTRWKSKILLIQVRALASPSDVAFAILILENNEKVWFAQYRITIDREHLKSDSQITTVPQPLYNSHRGEASTKYSGWSKQAIDNYTDLLELIESVPKSKKRVFDKAYLEKVRAEERADSEQKRAKRRKPSVVREKTSIKDLGDRYNGDPESEEE
jgi:hypothetical protein